MSGEFHLEIVDQAPIDEPTLAPGLRTALASGALENGRSRDRS
jgi:hypothetical protein